MKRLLVPRHALWLPVCAPTPRSTSSPANRNGPRWRKEIGGDDVRVYTATTALQDPHRIEARPSLIAQMRRADLVVCTGAELEVGWLPVLLREAGNAAVQPGRPGYFEAARFVPLLEKPARLDRADGDVHAAGNPHIHTDPRNILRVGEALTARLAEVDPANAAALSGARPGVRRALAGGHRTLGSRAPHRSRDLPVAVQHKSFSYLLAWLGMNEVAVLEPRPGVEPSVGHLARVATRLQTTPAENGAARGLPKPAPGRLAGEAHRHPGAGAALHRGRQRSRAGPVRPVRRHPRSTA